MISLYQYQLSFRQSSVAIISLDVSATLTRAINTPFLRIMMDTLSHFMREDKDY